MKSAVCALLLVLVFMLPHRSSAQERTTSGTDLWVVFLENRPVNDESRFSLFISSAVATTGAVTVPGTGLRFPFTLTGGQAIPIALPIGAFQAAGSEQIEPKGIRITADAPVSAWAIHNKIYFSDASIVLSAGALGSDYLVAAIRDPDQHSPSSFAIAAVEDRTIVEIIPSQITLGFHPAAVPYTITLNQGDVYQVKAFDDLTGTSVRSINGKRFALFGGAQASAIGCQDDSHVYDQVLPVRDWGLKYITAPFLGKRGDLLRVIASENGTSVRFNCGNQVLLDRGEYHDLVTAEPTVITADRPIGVVQFSRGQNCSGTGGPSMQFLPPVTSAVRSAIFYAPYRVQSGNSTLFYDRHHVNIVAKAGNTASVQIDGLPVAGFRPVPGDPRYSYAQVTLDTGSHHLEAPDGVLAYAYGVGEYDFYTFWLGADTTHTQVGDPAPMVLHQSAGFSSLSIGACNPAPGRLAPCSDADVMFSVDSLPLTSYFWVFGDGARAAGSRVVHAYDEPGTYLVRLVAIGPDCEIRTAERSVVVGDCATGLLRRLSINPNPLRDAAVVSYVVADEGDVVLEVFNGIGELVRAVKEERKPGRYTSAINLAGLPPGTYIVRLSDRRGALVELVRKVE